MHVWQHLSRYTQGLILIMVSILFFLWGILGGAQVEKQNDTLLRGVHEAVDESFALINTNQEIILAQGRYLTCVLKMRPEDRSYRDTRRCLRESGLRELTNE